MNETIREELETIDYEVDSINSAVNNITDSLNNIKSADVDGELVMSLKAKIKQLRGFILETPPTDVEKKLLALEDWS